MKLGLFQVKRVFNVKLGSVQNKGAASFAADRVKLRWFEVVGVSSFDAEWLRLGFIQVKGVPCFYG